MKILEQSFDAVDEAMIEAFAGHITWDEALAVAARSVGANAMTIHQIVGAGQIASPLGSVGFAQYMLDEYFDHYFQFDPRIAMRGRVPQSTILFDSEITDDIMQSGGEKFFDWLSRNGAPNACASLIIPKQDDSALVIGVYRYSMAPNDRAVHDFLLRLESRLRLIETSFDAVGSRTLSRDGDGNLASSKQEIALVFDSTCLLIETPPPDLGMLFALNILDESQLPQVAFLDQAQHESFLRAVAAAQVQRVSRFAFQCEFGECTAMLIVRDVGGGGVVFHITFSIVVRAKSEVELIAVALGLTRRQSELVSLTAKGASIATGGKHQQR